MEEGDVKVQIRPFVITMNQDGLRGTNNRFPVIIRTFAIWLNEIMCVRTTKKPDIDNPKKPIVYWLWVDVTEFFL